MALPNLNKTVLAQVFVNVEVSGTTGGTCIIPIHELLLLRRKVKDIGRGVTAVISLDASNRPGWQYRIGDDGVPTDEETLPRVKGMTLTGFKDEYARLTRKYKYQITENRWADAFVAVYETQKRLAESMKKMHEAYDRLSEKQPDGSRKRLLTLDDWESIARIASPEAELLELEEITLTESLATDDPGSKTSTPAARPPKPKEDGRADGPDLEALGAYLKEANWSAEIVAAAQALVAEHGTNIAEELIEAEGIPGIGGKKTRIAALQRSISEFGAVAAVGH